MADLPEALDAALSDHYSVRQGIRSPVESRRGFQARVRALEKAYGSKRAAAAAAGFDPTTWSRWSTGKQRPAASSLARIAAAHLSLTRAAKAGKRGTPTVIEIQADVACVPSDPRSKQSKYYNRSSYRWFRADRLTGPQRSDVVTAWAAGKSPPEVATVLLDAVQRAYGSRFAFEGSDVNVRIY